MFVNRVKVKKTILFVDKLETKHTIVNVGGLETKRGRKVVWKKNVAYDLQGKLVSVLQEVTRNENNLCRQSQQKKNYWTRKKYNARSIQKTHILAV